jgi:peptidoglycan/xylan/chitin deacetylase (PgdA/CDA1 family)
VRTLLRRVLTLFGVVLYHAGLAPLVIWLNRRTPKVLLYHACESVESDFIRGLHSNTTPHAFAEQLDFLRERYQVIPLALLEKGPIPDRAVVITFDDGYRSVYDAAYPLLAARGMPATVYLVTDAVDNRILVWVNALNWLLHRHPGICAPIAQRYLRTPIESRSPREHVLHAQDHYDAGSIEAALAEMWEASGIDPAEFAAEAGLYLTTAEIRELTVKGWSFGSHTARHPNLRCLDDSQRRAELETALRFIAELGGRPSLAYPFGEFDSGTRRVALSLGHRTVMQVGGVNRPLQLTAVARVPVTAESRAQFFAEMEIVTPLLAWAKRLTNHLSLAWSG